VLGQWLSQPNSTAFSDLLLAQVGFACDRANISRYRIVEKLGGGVLRRWSSSSIILRKRVTGVSFSVTHYVSCP
jgi:hypothetical protein